MMTMLLVFSLAMWLGIASGEPGKRVLLEGNVEMNYNTEITLLKQQMVSQISEINQLRQQVSEISQLRQQVSNLEQTKGKSSTIKLSPSLSALSFLHFRIY